MTRKGNGFCASEVIGVLGITGYFLLRWKSDEYYIRVKDKVIIYQGKGQFLKKNIASGCKIPNTIC